MTKRIIKINRLGELGKCVAEIATHFNVIAEIAILKEMALNF